MAGRRDARHARAVIDAGSVVVPPLCTDSTARPPHEGPHEATRRAHLQSRKVVDWPTMSTGPGRRRSHASGLAARRPSSGGRCSRRCGAPGPGASSGGMRRCRTAGGVRELSARKSARPLAMLRGRVPAGGIDGRVADALAAQKGASAGGSNATSPERAMPSCAASERARADSATACRTWRQLPPRRRPAGLARPGALPPRRRP